MDVKSKAKVIGERLFYICIHIAFWTFLYLGAVEGVKGAQNILYVYVGLGTLVSTIAILCLSDDKFNESMMKNSSDFLRYTYLVSGLIACATLFWNSFFWTGLFHLYTIFVTQIIYSSVRDWQKKQVRMVETPSDLFPSDWEKI